MAAYIYHLIAYKILYLTVYFVLQRSLAYYTGTCNHFLGYFGFYLLTAVYTKKLY